MVSVFDVAKYILKQKGKLSTMKLQKLCYYAQAWSLVWDDAPLFEEEFEAWANGPVCKELFLKTQGKFWVTDDEVDGDISKLKNYQKETIDAVLNHYGNKDAQWLNRLTHMEDPWRKARKRIPNDVGYSNIINKESMAIYYSGLE